MPPPLLAAPRGVSENGALPARVFPLAAQDVLKLFPMHFFSSSHTAIRNTGFSIKALCLFFHPKNGASRMEGGPPVPVFAFQPFFYTISFSPRNFKNPPPLLSAFLFRTKGKPARAARLH